MILGHLSSKSGENGAEPGPASKVSAHNAGRRSEEFRINAIIERVGLSKHRTSPWPSRISTAKNTAFSP